MTEHNLLNKVYSLIMSQNWNDSSKPNNKWIKLNKRKYLPKSTSLKINKKLNKKGSKFTATLTLTSEFDFVFLTLISEFDFAGLTLSFEFQFVLLTLTCQFVMLLLVSSTLFLLQDTMLLYQLLLLFGPTWHEKKKTFLFGVFSFQISLHSRQQSAAGGIPLNYLYLN